MPTTTSTSVLVLGPPRSGSSCLTACISMLGFDLGKDPTVVKNQFNAKGYFENRAVLTFNEKVLSAVGGHIFQTTPLSTQQSGSSTRYVSELAALIDRQFLKRPFVIKDPRIALLSELYFSTLPEVKIVALRRDKTAVGESIARISNALARGPISPSTGLQICENYLRMVTEICLGRASLQVHFEDLIGQPGATIARLWDFLELPHSQQALAHCQDFIDQNLVRFPSGNHGY